MGGKAKRHKDEGRMGRRTRSKSGVFTPSRSEKDNRTHLAKQHPGRSGKSRCARHHQNNQGSILASAFGRDSALVPMRQTCSAVWSAEVGRSLRQLEDSDSLDQVVAVVALGEAPSVLPTWARSVGRRRRSVRLRSWRRRARWSSCIGTGRCPGTAGVRGSRQRDHPPDHPSPHHRSEVLLRARAGADAGTLGRVADPVHDRAGTGQVVASLVQSSTLNSMPVEQCIAQAVRRWEFPKPQGGGIVVVTYPFVLKASGGEKIAWPFRRKNAFHGSFPQPNWTAGVPLVRIVYTTWGVWRYACCSWGLQSGAQQVYRGDEHGRQAGAQKLYDRAITPRSRRWRFDPTNDRAHCNLGMV